MLNADAVKETLTAHLPEINEFEGFDDPSFKWWATRIVECVSDAGLYTGRLTVWPVADDDGTVFGGLVTRDIGRSRASSYYLEARKWGSDRTLTGIHSGVDIATTIDRCAPAQAVDLGRVTQALNDAADDIHLQRRNR